jgi:GxxExxY protein
MVNYLYHDLTETVIKGFFRVYNTLGFGFLEKVYEKALFIELTRMGLNVARQHRVTVYYDGHEVGDYFADLVVEHQLIIEIKAAECLREEHECQLINYLKATDIEVGLLFNFGKKPQFKRKIFTNDFKQKD